MSFLGPLSSSSSSDEDESSEDSIGTLLLDIVTPSSDESESDMMAFQKNERTKEREECSVSELTGIMQTCCCCLFTMHPRVIGWYNGQVG